MSISVPGAVLRNSLALAAEFVAIMLMRGPAPHWLPVMLGLVALMSGLPNGTDTEFVRRMLLAIGAVLIALCGSYAWDQHALRAYGRVERVVDVGTHLHTQSGRDLGALPLGGGGGGNDGLQVLVDPHGPAWQWGTEPDPEPAFWETVTGGLLLIQTISLTRISRRRPAR
ncbi:hypothetical protein [Streptomyces sp. NBC_00503]|uniref:hypothetical protein n=1 Tax=Streptomyces sp. NBC_00503 TaxID=2903659 RepID=UPI002E803A27|nr:hypothetical protein [Streptomyces sp. NBC_00503]WUD80819.1 hypothetical protein OG490_09810 [Streptomyces sp. NBC_00503]